MRKLATLALSFACGIGLCQYLLSPDWLLPGAAAALAVFAAAVFFLGKGRRRTRLLLMAAGAYLAFVWTYVYVDLVQAPAEALAETYVEDAVLEVCDWPVETSFGAKVTCRLHREGIRLVKTIYYGGESLLDLRPGDRLLGGVYFASAARVDDTDLSAFTSKGVFLLGYHRQELSVEPGGDPVRYLPQRAGRFLREKLEELYSGDTAAFLQAILTGDKSALSEGAYTNLSEAGLLHITAVSGMHCMFLLALLRLLIGRHRRRLLACIGAPALVFYVLLTGASPSAVRACVMAVFLLAAPLLGREPDPPTALSAALLVILLQNPFAIASVSLQLSFAAVAGLLWLTPRVYRGLMGGRNREGWSGGACRFLASSLASTAGALVFTIPLTAVYFGSLALVSPLSNLLCLWAATGIFTLGLLSVLTGALWLPLGMVFAWPVRLLTGYLLAAARLTAGLPGHAVYFDNGYLKYWTAYVYALLLLCCLLGRGQGRRRWLLAGVLACASLALTVRLGAMQYRSGALDIVAVDVGQGESVILTSGGQTAVMDCGSGNSWISAGDETADLLATMGVRHLDYLALTHYHADHANGMAALLARVEVDTLLLPDIGDEYGLKDQLLTLAADHGIAVEYIRERFGCALGKAELTLFPPLGSGSTNEEGISLLCSMGDFDFLLTGDMDSTTEGRLLAEYPLPELEVLMAGHHGSKYSTSKELLQKTRPEAAVVSVGDNNYGHPTAEALGRLVRAGAAVYRTDLQGNIHISVHDDGKE